MVGNGVGVEERGAETSTVVPFRGGDGEGLESGGIPVVVGGEGGRLVVVLHVDYVRLPIGFGSGDRGAPREKRSGKDGEEEKEEMGYGR